MKPNREGVECNESKQSKDEVHGARIPKERQEVVDHDRHYHNFDRWN